MLIVESCSWRLGVFTVYQRPRFSAPAWPQYLVYIGPKLIGKQFSRPSLDDCRWLEIHAREECVVYASAARRIHPYREYSIRGGQATRRNLKRETQPA